MWEITGNLRCETFRPAKVKGNLTLTPTLALSQSLKPTLTRTLTPTLTPGTPRRRPSALAAFQPPHSSSRFCSSAAPAEAGRETGVSSNRFCSSRQPEERHQFTTARNNTEKCPWKSWKILKFGCRASTGSRGKLRGL